MREEILLEKIREATMASSFDGSTIFVNKEDFKGAREGAKIYGLIIRFR